MPEHQQRLKRQAGWRWRPRYEPNHVYIGHRLALAVLTVTWTAWAVIGVLSGHMYFFAGVPIHFSGLPALLFSFAVLAAAAACASIIVDHDDRRDNEAAYRRFKRHMWWGAAGLFGCALLVALTEDLSLLPWTDGRLGLLSGRGLRGLLQADWLARLLQPHVETLQRWTLYTIAWAVLGGIAAKKLGLIPDSSSDVTVGSGLACAALLLPVMTVFTLGLLADVSMGHIAQNPALTPDEVKAEVAWIHSMLVAALGAWGFIAVAFGMAVLRALRIIPHPPGYQQQPELRDPR